MSDALDAVLRAIDAWPASTTAAAVIGADGGRASVLATHGRVDVALPWASVTKPVTAWAVLVAVDQGRIDLDEPAGPPGATIRHLLAHASGLPFDGTAVLAQPGRRRIYSNTAYDLLGELLPERVGMPFDAWVRTVILDPLGMTATRLVGRPSAGITGPLVDLAAFAGELLRPRLLATPTARAATSLAFPGLPGVVPAVGNFDPCDWGLGPEIHGTKRPHWIGGLASPQTYGHFGGSGTFVWCDPTIDLAVAVLTDRTFGPWALEAWPPFSDAIIAAAGQGRASAR